MRLLALSLLAALAVPQAASAASCKLSPKQVVTRFMTQFYVDKDVKGAFETWVDPGYIQHNPMARTGRDAAIAFLAPFFASNPDVHYEIRRVIADGDLVAVHSHGTLKKGDPGVAVVDILRVKGCKVMEHWDVVQPVPAKSANENTMF
ncbi:MAG: nuclear transport factor 2 family protein [Sphingomonadales bacterium]|nr:nuclear transport factor 2 family protein [Sphingomonadales bacterium]MDE2567444.1 nuclear transport factor 2 family protein [Sphingomonadales bacterium]